MFDDPSSLRETARRYKHAASQTTERDIIHVFTAAAEQYERKAASLELERQNGTVLYAWDSILRRQPTIQLADHPV